MKLKTHANLDQRYLTFNKYYFIERKTTTVEALFVGTAISRLSVQNIDTSCNGTVNVFNVVLGNP